MDLERTPATLAADGQPVAMNRDTRGGPLDLGLRLCAAEGRRGFEGRGLRLPQAVTDAGLALMVDPGAMAMPTWRDGRVDPAVLEAKGYGDVDRFRDKALSRPPSIGAAPAHDRRVRADQGGLLSTMTVFLQERRPRRERADNAARRRAQILDATIELIVRHGLSATTLATVAEEAGLSQGVTVFYFKTKQALLAEALRWHYEEYRKVWRAALEVAPLDPVAASWPWSAPTSTRRSATGARSPCGTRTGARPPPGPCSPASPKGSTASARRPAKPVRGRRGPARPGRVDARAGVGLDSLSDGLWLRMHLDPDSMDNAAAIGDHGLRRRGLPFPTPGPGRRRLGRLAPAATRRPQRREREAECPRDAQHPARGAATSVQMAGISMADGPPASASRSKSSVSSAVGQGPTAGTGAAQAAAQAVGDRIAESASGPREPAAPARGSGESETQSAPQPGPGQDRP